MKAKIIFIGLLLASSATNADFRPFDLGESLKKAEEIKAMRQERELREMQMQQMRQQQELQRQERQQQSLPTRKACMKDCKEAGYKYSECRVECPPQ